MSTDIWIGEKSFNYTHNCSAVWYDHIPDTGKGGGFREIAGMTGKQAFPILSAAFDRLDQTRHGLWVSGAVGEPRMSARYDAPNGWGSLIGALIFMACIMAACAENPRKKVGLSI